MSVLLLLAQGGRSGGSMVGVLTWVGAGVVVALLGGAVAVRLRRLAMQREQNEAGDLAGLSQMAARGEISGAEYEAIRRSAARIAVKRAEERAAAKARAAELARENRLTSALGGVELTEHSRASARPRVETDDSDKSEKGGGERRAAPGFDLLGRPLPKARSDYDQKPRSEYDK